MRSCSSQHNPHVGYVPYLSRVEPVRLCLQVPVLWFSTYLAEHDHCSHRRSPHALFLAAAGLSCGGLRAGSRADDAALLVELMLSPAASWFRRTKRTLQPPTNSNERG